jgi:methyl-accepting chemotaxis protein
MATADAKIRIVAEDKTQKAFKSVDKNLNKTSDALKGLAKRFILAAGAAGVGGFVTKTIHAADKLTALSIRLGVSTKALSEYKHVAEIGGVTFETLTMAWQRMTRRIAEAAIGMGEAKGALKELGLNAEELNKLPLDEKFEIVADALAGLGSESDRVRLAMKLFDSEGVSLIQTMEGGAEGIRKVRQMARDLGLTLDKTTTKAAAKLVDEMTNVKAALQGIANSALPAILPLLTDLAIALQGGINALKDWGKELKYLALVFAELYVIKNITPLIIAMNVAMQTATFSARGLGLAMKGMLGGIPGLIAIAATAWVMFRDDTEEATKAVEEQTGAVKKLRKEFAGLGLEQLIKQEQELKIEFAEISEELRQLNLMLDEKRKLMAFVPNVTGLKSYTDAAKDLNTAIVKSGNAVRVLADPELVALQDRYDKLKVLLAEVRKQIDEVTKSTDESAKSTDESAKSTDDLNESTFDLVKVLDYLKQTVHQGEKAWVGLGTTLSKTEQAMKDFKDEVARTQFESDFLIDKMVVLDQLLQDGKIHGDVYTAWVERLNEAMGDAGEETVLLTQDIETLGKHMQSFADNLASGITDAFMYIMFEQGKLKKAEKERHASALSDIKKRYDKEVADLKKMLDAGTISHAEYNAQLKAKHQEYVDEKLAAEKEFEKNMGEINKSIGDHMKEVLLSAFKSLIQDMLKEWLKSKILKMFSGSGGGGFNLGGIIAGIKSIFTGHTSSGVVASGVSSAVGSAAGSAAGAAAGAGTGLAMDPVTGGWVSSGTLPAATAGSGPAAAAGGASGYAAMLAPVALFAAGFLKIRKRYKEDRIEFGNLMADKEVRAKMFQGVMTTGFNTIKRDGTHAWVQVSEKTNEYIKQLDAAGQRKSKGEFFWHNLVKVRDEFGNVIARAKDVQSLWNELQNMTPFIGAIEQMDEFQYKSEKAVSVQGEVVNSTADLLSTIARSVDAFPEATTAMADGMISVKEAIEMGLNPAVAGTTERFRELSQDAFAVSSGMTRLGQAGVDAMLGH